MFLHYLHYAAALRREPFCAARARGNPGYINCEARFVRRLARLRRAIQSAQVAAPTIERTAVQASLMG
jgi:hypothetical protein